MINAFYISFVVILLWAVFQAWRHQAQTETVQPWKSFSHLLAWYLPYLLLPILALLVYLLISVQIRLELGIIGVALVMCCLYARFVEPQILKVKYHTRAGFLPKGSSAIRVAFLSDLHIGLFSGHPRQLYNIVEQINRAKPDVVLIGGDWTYEPSSNLKDDLHILKYIDAPVFSVLGNHDEQLPGPPIRETLLEGLQEADIYDIEGCIIDYGGFYLVGIGDLWAGRADLEILKQCPKDKPYVLLSHNPDTAEMVPDLQQNTLMLSGHTHGGQVALPWITEYYLRKMSICGHVAGWYRHQHTDLFITVGTGMVGIPFRFCTPPTIDMIELTP